MLSISSPSSVKYPRSTPRCIPESETVGSLPIRTFTGGESGAAALADVAGAPDGGATAAGAAAVGAAAGAAGLAGVAPELEHAANTAASPSASEGNQDRRTA